MLLIRADLVGVDEITADMIRDRVSDMTGVSADNIMLCFSHTHSGPMIFKRYTLEPAEPKIAERIDAYIESLAEKIVTISLQACSIKLKGKIYASTFVGRVGYNRRYFTKDENGNDGIKMLFSNWQSLGDKPNGLVDNNIPILLIEKVDESPCDSYLGSIDTDRIVLFNVPAHAVVMGPLNRYVSVDYPGAARKCIEEILGNGTKAMFLLGASGNINCLLALYSDFKSMEIIGNLVGYGVCAALSSRQEVEFDGLRSITEDIPLKESPAGKRVRTQVFKIGNAAIAAVSGENFTELGMRIKESSKFDQTLVATLANGGGGYIPTRDAMLNWGGYEVDIANMLGYDENLHDNIVEMIIKNMNRI